MTRTRVGHSWHFQNGDVERRRKKHVLKKLNAIFSGYRTKIMTCMKSHIQNLVLPCDIFRINQSVIPWLSMQYNINANSSIESLGAMQNTMFEHIALCSLTVAFSISLENSNRGGTFSVWKHSCDRILNTLRRNIISWLRLRYTHHFMRVQSRYSP